MNPFTWTKITAAVGYIQLSRCNEDKIPQTFSPLYISMFSIRSKFVQKLRRTQSSHGCLAVICRSLDRGSRGKVVQQVLLQG